VQIGFWVGLWSFDSTFNNISVISWQSVLLVEEKPEYPEKTTNLSQVTDELYHMIDFWYSNPTFIQARDPNVNKLKYT